MNKLNELVDQIRKDDPERQVAGFDPAGGKCDSEILFLLEAPGPMAALGKGSGIISPDDDDPSARRFKEQLNDAGLDRRNAVIWNVVPWYLGDGKSIKAASVADIAKARTYLDALLTLLPRLKFVVLMGEKARKELVYLSGLNKFEVLGLHHTSDQSFRADRKDRFTKENMAVLRKLAAATNSAGRQTFK